MTDDFATSAPAEAVAHRVLRAQDLSPDQRLAYDAVLVWKKTRGQLLTLGGYAGTGKTSVVSVLAAEGPFKRIAFCTMTGKAAGVLRAKLLAVGVSLEHHSCSTIHSLVYRPRINEKTGVVLGWERRAKLDEKYDLILVDEASMLDEAVFGHLREFNIPILAVGDHGQLPPVRGQLSLMERPQLRLEKIHRQAEDSPIIQLSVAIRERGELPRNLDDGEAVDFIDRARIFDFVRRAYRDLSGPALLERALLCYTNARRSSLNQCVRETRFGAGVRKLSPVPRDQVICLRNVRGEGDVPPVYNGMRGFIVSEIAQADHAQIQAKVRFVEERVVIDASMNVHQFGRPKTFSALDEFHPYGARPERWGDVGMLFDFGYALTCHKAQGSQFRHVLVDCERPSMVDEDSWRRWLYTAATRSSDRLVLAT